MGSYYDTGFEGWEKDALISIWIMMILMLCGGIFVHVNMFRYTRAGFCFLLSFYSVCTKAWTVVHPHDPFSSQLDWWKNSPVFHVGHASAQPQASYVSIGLWKAKCASKRKGYDNRACNPDNIFGYTFPQPSNLQKDVTAIEFSVHRSNYLDSHKFFDRGGWLPAWNAEASRAQIRVLDEFDGHYWQTARAFACLTTIFYTVGLLDTITSNDDDDENIEKRRFEKAMWSLTMVLFLSITIGMWVVINGWLGDAFPARNVTYGPGFHMQAIMLAIEILWLLRVTCGGAGGMVGGSRSRSKVTPS